MSAKTVNSEGFILVYTSKGEVLLRLFTFTIVYKLTLQKYAIIMIEKDFIRLWQCCLIADIAVCVKAGF